MARESKRRQEQRQAEIPAMAAKSQQVVDWANTVWAAGQPVTVSFGAYGGGLGGMTQKQVKYTPPEHKGRPRSS